MIELYGNASTRALRCLWAAEECGAPYKHVPIDFATGAHQTPAYLAMNPNARVPTLRDGDLVIFESTAIAIYIAERHPEAALIPKRPTRESALFDQWMYWLGCELEQALWSLAKHKFALPATYRIEDMKKTARFEYERAVPVLAAAVKGRDHIVGDGFTLVDLFAAHNIMWAKRAKMEVSDDLERYASLHMGRPACTRALSLL